MFCKNFVLPKAAFAAAEKTLCEVIVEGFEFGLNPGQHSSDKLKADSRWTFFNESWKQTHSVVIKYYVEETLGLICHH